MKKEKPNILDELDDILRTRGHLDMRKDVNDIPLCPPDKSVRVGDEVAMAVRSVPVEEVTTIGGKRFVRGFRRIEVETASSVRRAEELPVKDIRTVVRFVNKMKDADIDLARKEYNRAKEF